MATAWERRASGLLGGYSGTIGAIDSTAAVADAESAAATFSDQATVFRQVKDADGTLVLQETTEGQSPLLETVYEGPANLIKTNTPRFITEAGGREDIADWQAEFPISSTNPYNPEAGDILLMNGFVFYVKGSDEGMTNASVLTVYLLRKGRDNEGF